MEQSGELVDKLKYKGKHDHILTDLHIERLASALLTNDKFEGPLEL